MKHVFCSIFGVTKTSTAWNISNCILTDIFVLGMVLIHRYTDAASSLLRLGLAADKCNATNSQSKVWNSI